MTRLLPFLVALPLLLSACSSFYQRTPGGEETNVDGLEQRRSGGGLRGLTQGEPAENPLRPDRGIGTNYNVSTEEELMSIDNGAEGPVYYTDPDNPDKEIEGIEEAFSRKLSANRWLTNYRSARRLAASECRPLIIWFHDSFLSPKSRKLGSALLETPYFEDWAGENAVRVRLDAGLRLQDNRPTNVKSYSAGFVNGLAAQYGLRKKPAIVVVAPDGFIAGRIDGCSPDEANVIDSEIRSFVKQAQEHFGDVKKKLEEKGYRVWHDRREKESMFALFLRYDEKKGMVYFKEFTGRVRRAGLRRLSTEDQNWLRSRGYVAGR
ncbi:MAG: hypothetical protein LUG84_01795 [Akkermansiaceae bacterium]|nr:hypothetical protein [Akkermansiaceae bacterium]